MSDFLSVTGTSKVPHKSGQHKRSKSKLLVVLYYNGISKQQGFSAKE